MIEYTVKVFDDGRKEWFLDGFLHREDGPAIETSGGTKIWYIQGKRHREDGPAMEYSGGSNLWYINNVNYSEEEFNNKINPKDCSGSTVVVDGVEYTLNLKK
jgi:hypothetical protein